jgi:hypothetical protein
MVSTQTPLMPLRGLRNIGRYDQWIAAQGGEHTTPPHVDIQAYKRQEAGNFNKSGPSDFQTKREAMGIASRKRVYDIEVESVGPEDFETKRQAMESTEFPRLPARARGALELASVGKGDFEAKRQATGCTEFPQRPARSRIIFLPVAPVFNKSAFQQDGWPAQAMS